MCESELSAHVAPGGPGAGASPFSEVTACPRVQEPAEDFRACGAQDPELSGPVHQRPLLGPEVMASSPFHTTQLSLILHLDLSDVSTQGSAMTRPLRDAGVEPLFFPGH